MRSSAARVPGRSGAKPPSSPRPGGELLGLQHRLERVVDLRAPAQRLLERVGAHRGDHELLHVDGRVGVRATVDDVHHRHREHVRVGAADVAEQLQPRRLRRRLRHRQRHAQQRVGPQPRLGRRAVEVDEALVDQPLVDRLHAHELGTDLVQHRGDGLLDALAAEAQRVAVAQLVRLVLARRRARWHRRAGQCAVVERNLDLDRRIAPRVEDLACADLLDDRHRCSIPRISIVWSSP